MRLAALQHHAIRTNLVLIFFFIMDLFIYGYIYKFDALLFSYYLLVFWIV